jgi:hypothetical protein
MSASSKKRKADPTDLRKQDLSDYESNMTSLHDSFLTGNKEQATKAFLYLMAASKVTITSLKASQDTLPSFSSATWGNVCNTFNLNPLLGIDQLDQFKIPDLVLPPSVHKRVLMAAARAMDVYREPSSQENEAARVRLFEAVSGGVILLIRLTESLQWHVPLCQLFHGRIIDKPEGRLPATEFSSGGQIEHELFALDLGVILLVFELKYGFQGAASRDPTAQAFLEMQCERNSTA